MDVRDAIDAQREDFVWKDAERLIAFGRAALASLPAFLRAQQFERFALVSTERALAQFSSLAIGGGETVERASAELLLGGGDVSELAAAAIDSTQGLPIVAVGGGRVIDSAKAVAGVTGVQVAAIPTTLSGAPMTSTHRLPTGHSGVVRTVRPSIVVNTPDLSASQPPELRTGSAMNALSHGVESLFVEGASAVPRLAAARGVGLILRTLQDPGLDEPTTRQRLALGALECGYALGSTGYALHHVLCQTVVRLGGLPHAPVYGVLLPYTLELYKLRDELTWQLISEEVHGEDPARVVASVVAAAGLPTSLSALGLSAERLDGIVAAASERRELQLTPGGASTEELSELLHAAF